VVSSSEPAKSEHENTLFLAQFGNKLFIACTNCNSASPWPCGVCNKYVGMMNYCNEVVAFLDSITEVDSRVFFPRWLWFAFQPSITFEFFTLPPKLELA